VTLTDATVAGAEATVIDSEPVFAPLVALICAEPAATAVTSPLAETVAMPAFEDDHVINWPVRTFPLESRVVAVACVVCPIVRLVAPAATVTVATGTVVPFTVIPAVPLFPWLVAVIVADPADTPVMTPPSPTLATVLLELE
jgi:hypothetical protein